MTFEKGVKFLAKPADRNAAIAERALPPLLDQARNFSGAVARTAKRIAEREPVLVARKVAEQRAQICRACEFFRAQHERCAHPKCGCFTRVKAWLKAEACPATPAKW